MNKELLDQIGRLVTFFLSERTVCSGGKFQIEFERSPFLEFATALNSVPNRTLPLPTDNRSSTQVSRLKRLIRSLDLGRFQSAEISIGLPTKSDKDSCPLLTDRICFWPQGIPTGHRTVFLSSQLGKAPDRKRAWFDALLSQFRPPATTTLLAVTSQGMTADPYVRRCADLYQKEIIDVHLPNRIQNILDWFEEVVRDHESKSYSYEYPLLVSPPTIGPQVNELNADRLLHQWCDESRILFVRRRGLIHSILQGKDVPSRNSHFLLSDPSLTEPSLFAELFDGTFNNWQVEKATQASREIASVSNSSRSKSGQHARQDFPELSEEIPNADFLFHCTRHCQGPWPGQTEDDFHDDLLFGNPGADHSAFASLIRIVNEQRIRASSKLIRGSHQVVCFTEMNVVELKAARVYRPHLKRWDFEPYGIAIGKKVLVEQGAHEVIYGGEKLWKNSPPTLQPFLQKMGANDKKNARNRPAIDWSKEREWRIVGDLELNGIELDQLVIFVPTIFEAKTIAEHCPWPVAVFR